MSTQQWWYEEGGQAKGPLASQEIRSMVETGALARSSRIIVVGGTEWATIDEHANELGLGPEPSPAAATASPMGGTASAGAAASGWGDGAGGTSAPPSQPAAPATASYAPPAPTPGPAQIGPAPLASAGKRLGAYLLDGLIFLVSVITLFLGWFIWALVIFGKGQTPGKQILGLRVVNAESGRVTSYGNMALRTLVYELLLGSVTGGITTIVGGVMLLADNDKRQALWDKMANTVVVDDPEGRTL